MAPLPATAPLTAQWPSKLSLEAPALYFAEPDLARRSAALGLDITTTLSFSWGKGEVVRERVGEGFLDDFIPLARLLDGGLHVAVGTDWGPRSSST